MTIDEVKTNLSALIAKYVTDKATKERLLHLVERNDVPVKGILVELTSFTTGRVSEKDGKVIGEIAFFFC